MKPSLHDVVEPVLTVHNLELDDLSTVRAGSRVIVRVTVDGDGPDGHGPTLDDVAQASSAISKALDESAAMGDRSYVLEVGTRGVGKPLTAPRQWRRNQGRLVTVTTVTGESFTDRIVEATDDGVRLAERGFLAFPTVEKAVVQVEMKGKVPEGE